jgi:hypothetical protein
MSVPGETLPGMETFACGVTLAGQLAGVPVRTGADVLARVAAILDPATRREPTLWLFFLDPGGLQLKAAMPWDDLPAYPGPGELEGMFEALDRLFAPQGPAGSVILAITRCGTAGLTESDQRWAAALGRATAENGIPVRMLCLATPEGVRELALALEAGARGRPPPGRCGGTTCAPAGELGGRASATRGDCQTMGKAPPARPPPSPGGLGHDSHHGSFC